ncbi:MAG TPA: hypothetical protein PLV92_15315, partial [Pirellulaceae bacterium]|nr:hypothetical protein [Pirellulaceae bacterium]
MAAIALLGVVQFVVSCNSAFAAGPRDEVWRQVKKAEEDGQLELALRRLKPLEAELRRDADWAALSRAIVQRVVLEEAIAEGYKHLSEGNWNHAATTARIVRLTEACATAPRETKPLLDFVLYSWYRDQLSFYHLKSKGVRRPSQRKFEMDDWDRARIQVAVVAQLDKLLGEEAVMRQMPIERLDDWFGDGNLPATYRPTVFDWVAFQVLNMLDHDIGERCLFETDVAELPPLAELFSDREAFLKFEFRWRPHQVLEDRAFRWLKRRLGAHLDDADPAALVAADLARLMFMIDISGRSAVDAYERALRRLAERHQSHESVSLVYHDLADLLISQDRTKEGVEAAQRGATAFPASIGARGCRRLLALARTSKIELQLSHDSPARCGVLQVNSERAPRIELRLVKLDWNEELSVIYRRSWGEPNDDAPEDDVADAGTDDYETDDLRRWLKRPVSRRWSLTFDQSLGEQQTKNLALPEDLAPGCYVIMACRDDRFSLDAPPGGDDGATPVVGEPLVVALKFWSGSMKLVQSDYGLRGIQGIVLDARTGSPLQGARPRVWELGMKQMREIHLPESLVTDQHGRFMIDVGEQHAKYIVIAERGNETSGCWLTSAEWPFQRARSNADWNEEAEKPSIKFQIDRRSYRPGESIAFWGQVRGPARLGFRPVKGQEVVIGWSGSLAIATLSDADSSTPSSEKALAPDRPKSSTMPLTTDEFGVFSGRISLPPTISETTTPSLYASTKVVSKS